MKVQSASTNCGGEEELRAELEKERQRVKVLESEKKTLLN
jgi:hypothetical protein